MTSPVDISISCSEPALLPEKEFMIKSATMTPTAQSHRDFLLNTTLVDRDTLSPTCTCTCNQSDARSDECKKCAPSTKSNNTRPVVRAESPESPLLPPSQSAPEGLTVTRNMSTGYGSTSRSPSPMEDNSLLVRASPASINTRRIDVVEASVRCACHVKVKDSTSRKARIKLVAACVIALAFMIGEVVGGYFSHSLAIMTDAAHMLSDFASFLISLFSIWMATRPPSKRMSFGWHRAEVMGAVISVLIIWLITGVLVYEAVLRVIHYDNNIDADIMLITACVGVFVNVFMCMVLHQHDHDHGHGHGHGHGHSHSHSHDNEESVGGSIKKRRWWRKDRHQENEGEDFRDLASGEGRKRKRGSGKNINVRAAFIHVIGDLIQSIGVVIAGYIIKFFPQWHIVDPICTFLFSILVIISTLNVLRDAMLVLMEGAPRNIDTEAVEKDLRGLADVEHVHNIHIWSLTVNKAAIAAHLAIKKEADVQAVLEAASEMLRNKYGFSNTTLQVEHFQDVMETCGPCQQQPGGNGRKNSRVFCNSETNECVSPTRPV